MKKVKKLSAKAQKRILIAKDVLAQIRASKIEPSRGIYVEFDCSESAFGPRALVTKALNAPAEDRPVCQVCALGSMFIATVMKDKKSKLQLEEISRSECVQALSPYFSEQQLDLIESEFESSYGNDEKEELVRIMKNIVKNNGEYVSQWCEDENGE